MVIPEGVKKIAEAAFISCHIKSVKFPDSLDLIEDRAFFCCDELESIDFGNSIFSIGGMYSESAFSYCKSLKGCYSLENQHFQIIKLLQR